MFFHFEQKFMVAAILLYKKHQKSENRPQTPPAPLKGSGPKFLKTGFWDNSWPSGPSFWLGNEDPDPLVPVWRPRQIFAKIVADIFGCLKTLKSGFFSICGISFCKNIYHSQSYIL